MIIGSLGMVCPQGHDLSNTTHPKQALVAIVVCPVCQQIGIVLRVPVGMIPGPELLHSAHALFHRMEAAKPLLN